MKVLMIHVGDPVEKKDDVDPALYLEMVSFNDGQLHCYRKKDMINAVSQMRSLQAAGVDIEYGVLSGRKSLRSLLLAGLRLRRLVREKKPDVVHVLWGVTSSLITVLFSPAPVVVSFCGSDLYGYVDAQGHKNARAMITRWLSQISALFAAGIVTKSEAMRDLLPESSRKKVAVIPNGIDLLVFKPIERSAARSFLQWSNEKKIVLFFPGDGGVVKDQPLAEEIFRIIKQALPEAELVLVKGVTHEQLIYYYNAADLMLLTSFHEGSNNSLKEALACNLPIVSVNCGDAMERLRGVQASQLVCSRDANELAQASIEILRSSQRSNGRDTVHNLAIERIVERVQAVYDNAVVASQATSAIRVD